MKEKFICSAYFLRLAVTLVRLTKRGGVVKNWKKRYFRLVAGPSPILEYFETDNATVPKGTRACA
jgi:hypothetical protein